MDKVKILALPDLQTYSYSRLCGIGITTDKQSIETELSSEIGPNIWTIYFQCIWTVDFQQRCKGNLMGEKIVFSTNSAEIIGYPYAKIFILIHT